VALRGPLRLPGQEPASIPAIDGPAEAVTVMNALVTEWPEADPLLWASLHRTSFAPGAVEEFGVAGATGEGLDLFTVESGQITVEAEGPMILWRAPVAPDAEPATLPAGSTVVLNAGDQLFVPAGAPFRRRNDGADPAVVFGFQITQLEVTHYPGEVTNVRVMPDKVLNAAPPAPAAMSLHRLRLRPGTSLSMLDLPGLQMLYVEEGSLDLSGARRLGDLEPESWATIPSGQGMAHFETTTGMANRGSEPVTFLVVTIDPER
jgi:mannose-6-phosphate isomerase-like protein (cupin superfamily)